MAEQTTEKWNKLAIVLGIIAGLLALTAALIRFLKDGHVDLGKIAAGIAVPLLIYSIAKRKRGR